MILLDTHVWIWWINRDPRLAKNELRALDEHLIEGPLFISDISFWEVQTAVAHGKLTLPIPLDAWLTQATRPLLIRPQRITPAVVVEIAKLNPFHKDPGDRIITATARVLGLPLATHDGDIIRSKAVPIWHP